MSETAEEIRVLHVDDEPDFADLSATYLQREDDQITVRTATSPDEGLVVIDEDEIDCIVSDYDMPDWNGIEFLRAVREDHPNLPFILYTGKGSEEVAADAISAGVTDYLQKETGTDQYTILANRIRNAVSARQSATEAKRSRYRLKQILKTVPSCVVQLNYEGHFIFANERAVELLDLEKTNLTDRTYNDPKWEITDFDGNRIPDKKLPFRQIRDSGEPLYGFRHKIEWPDGTQKILEVNGEPLFDNTGSIETVVFSLTDITDQWEYENRLQQTTARLQALFNNSPDMINIHDVDGNIIDPNPRLCKETGYSETELRDMKVWELDKRFNPDEGRALWEGMETGDKERLEGIYRRRDGSEFPVEVHIRRLNVDGDDRFMVIGRDISERKEHEQKRQQIINRMNDAVIDIDSEWRITLVNERTEDFAGLDESELLGRDFWDVFSDARGTRFEDEYRRAMEAREPVSIVDYYSGAEEWFDIDVYPNSDGGLAFYFQLVTEYKQREQELEQTRELLAQTERIANVGGWEIDPDTMDVFWTDNLFRILGVSYDEEPPLDEALDVYHEEDRLLVETAVEQALESGEPFDVEARFRRPDGEVRWLQVSGTPTVENGEVLTLCGAVQDITEQKEREQQHETAIEFLRSLYEVATDRTLNVNEKITRLLELGPEELGLPHGYLTRIEVNDGTPETGTQRVFEACGDHELLQPGNSCSLSDSYCRKTIKADGVVAIQDALAAGWENDPAYERFELGSYIGTTVIVDDDLYGTVFFASETPREEPFTDSDRTFVRLMSRLVGYELERDHARQTLEQQNERLEEFVSIVSHDLRNPLRVAEGHLELAREECGSDHLDSVGDALTRSQALIDDLLTLAHEGNEIRDTESVDLGALTETCWRNVATAEATIVRHTERTVKADQRRLQQLFENLYRNAIEHGGDNVTVTVGDLTDGFYIEDDGPGIPADRREKVFNAGYSTNEKGTGFGLSIVKQVSEAHDWDINVTEGSEGGARFEITGVEFTAE